MKIRTNIFLLLFLIVSFSFSQNTVLEGIVIGDENVESIHVINQTQKAYATTNNKGVFKIEAKTQDTIVFTSVQYKPYTHTLLTQKILKTKD